MKASWAVGNLAGKSRFKPCIRRFWKGGGVNEKREPNRGAPPQMLNMLKEGLTLELKCTDSDKPWEVSLI